jgi:hypothetical protein
MSNQLKTILFLGCLTAADGRGRVGIRTVVGVRDRGAGPARAVTHT